MAPSTSPGRILSFRPPITSTVLHSAAQPVSVRSSAFAGVCFHVLRAMGSPPNASSIASNRSTSSPRCRPTATRLTASPKLSARAVRPTRCTCAHPHPCSTRSTPPNPLLPRPNHGWRHWWPPESGSSGCGTAPKFWRDRSVPDPRAAGVRSLHGIGGTWPPTGTAIAFHRIRCRRSRWMRCGRMSRGRGRVPRGVRVRRRRRGGPIVGAGRGPPARR
mmetsp:Transcript_31943/g.32215  ORF Transcript_31943/g.32215 Transcript_31943/m.32215 type:complete len:218 (-) Transcript_31943:342-995(-)